MSEKVAPVSPDAFPLAFYRMEPGDYSLPGDWIDTRTPEERRAALQAAWRTVEEAWQDHALDPTEVAEAYRPYRIRAAWRIVRALAAALGVLHKDQGLRELPARAWQVPHPTRRGNLPPTPLAWLLERAQELPLLPGPETPPDQIEVYAEAAKAIAAAFKIERGTLRDPELGRRGLVGLTSRTLAVTHYPAPHEMMAWEGALVEQTTSVLATHSLLETRKILARDHGLHEEETTALVKQAKYHARTLVESDPEDDRALMILRLDELARRARSACDIRAEGMALKNMAVVMGLSRIEPEDDARAFAKVVKDYNAAKRELPDKESV